MSTLTTHADSELATRDLSDEQVHWFQQKLHDASNGRKW